MGSGIFGELPLLVPLEYLRKDNKIDIERLGWIFKKNIIRPCSLVHACPVAT